MKKFLAIYGAGFLSGVVTIECIKTKLDNIKLSREAEALSSKIESETRKKTLENQIGEMFKDLKAKEIVFPR